MPVMLAGVLVLIATHWQTSVSMYHLWSEIHSYNHAFLILPVCLYLVWERRHALAALRPRPNLLGVAIVAGFGALWLVSDIIDVAIGRQFALVGMIEGFLLAALGWRVFRALLFPLAYAWLVVPVDLGLLPIMQKMATNATAWGIGLVGLPTYVEGSFIEIPSGRYWIAEGCAGLNFLLSGFALALLYAEQMYESWPKRIICVVVMIVVAVVANWFRVFALILAGHYLQTVYSIKDHYLEGWIFFAAVMFIMMWIGLRFRDPVPAPRPDGASRTPQAGIPSGAGGIASYVAVAAITAAIGVAYPAYAAYLKDNTPPVAAVRIAFPDELGGWRSTDATSDWQVSFEGADAQAKRNYRKGNRSADLYVAYYQHQGEGRELVAYHNRVYDNETWQPQWERTATARIGGSPAEISVTQLVSGRRQRIVWHVYWVDGHYTHSPMLAKLLQAKTSLLFGDPRSGVIAVSSEDVENSAALETILQALPPLPSLIAPGAADR